MRLDGVLMVDGCDREIVRSVDTVVVERGTLPDGEVYDSLVGRSSNGGVIDLPALLAGRPQPQGDGFALHRISDAVSSRSVAAATYDAPRLCRPRRGRPGWH